MRWLLRGAALISLVALAGCGGDARDIPSDIPGYRGLVSQIEKSKVGRAPDHWIEIKNSADEWERTGLIFGYVDDYDECGKAIAGLKKVNHAREYRCVPAN